MPKEGQKEWQVEKIIQRGEQQGKTFYLVKWKGYPLKEATWQPITNLQNCQDAIIAFERKLHLHTQSLNKKKGSIKTLHSESDCMTEEPNKDAFCKQKAGIEDGGILITAEKTGLNPKIERETTSTQPQAFKEQNLTNIDRQDIEARLQKLETNPKQLQIEADIDEKKRLKFYQGDPEMAIEPDVYKKLKKDDLAIRIPDETNLKNQLQQISFHTKAYISQKSNKKEQQTEKNESLYFSASSKISNHSAVLNNQVSPLVSNKISENDVKFDNLKHFYTNFTKDEQFFSSDEQKPQQSIQAPKSVAKLIRSYERYYYCDKQLENHHKITLMNIMRKIQQKERIKIPINIIDISKNHSLLKELTPVKQVDQECIFDSLDLLIKTNYGWLALGKTENQYVITDVNLIKQNSWQLLISIIAKRNMIRDQ